MKIDRMSLRRPLQAVALLTRLPVRVTWEPDRAWGSLAGWFPAVGALIGSLLLGGAAFGCPRILGITSPGVAAALLLTLWAGLTGALHLDGWTDCCDGLFVPADRPRRLAIMADPHVGAFGVTGLILLLLVKYAALTELLTVSGATGTGAPWRALLPLAAAPVLARWVAVLMLAWPHLPLAHTGGMADRTRRGLGAAQVAGATLTVVGLGLVTGAAGATWAAGAVLAGAGVAGLARQRLGGLTGDVLGAAIECAETTVLVVASFNPGMR